MIKAKALGVDQEGSTARTTDDGPATFAAPPSLESMLDASRREGYYEEANRLLRKRLAATYREACDLRDALAAQMARSEALENDLGEALSLAYKFGTETRVEKRQRMHDLHGQLVVARELAIQGDEAINYACADLAKKLRSAAKVRR